MEPSVDSIAMQLLKGSALSKDEVDSRIRRAWDPNYWKTLNRGLSIGASHAAETLEAARLTSKQRSDVLQSFHQQAYFQTEPLFSQQALATMRGCVETLRTNRWPPVFAFVYDVFWQITRTPSLSRLLSEALGPRYRQNSRIWCFYIHAISGAKGFPPHVDGLNRPNRMITWIPLSDATLENGCIYVLPQHLVPTTLEPFPQIRSVGAEEMWDLLQAVKALPARAGSVLGWNTELIHWGSTCGRPEHPRISISVEFMGENEEPARDEPPLLDGCSLPCFASRLHAIGKGILDYQHYEGGLAVYRDFASRLVKEAAAQS